MLKKNIKFLNLFKKPLLKKNIMGFKQSAGRNSSGKITIRHRGGGHKKKLRKINFNRELNSIIGIVVNIEYDPNRNTFISHVYEFSLKTQQYLTNYKIPSNFGFNQILSEIDTLSSQAALIAPTESQQKSLQESYARSSLQKFLPVEASRHVNELIVKHGRKRR